MPEDMEKYLSYYGLHFNKKLYEFAAGMMKKKDRVTGRVSKVEPIEMEDLRSLLSRYNVEIEPTDLYDALYLATMVKADMYGSRIEDDIHMARYISDVICDPDGYEGIVLCRFIADCNAKGVGIFWDMML
jgi:hypothetical protein